MKPSAYEGLNDQQLAHLFKTAGDQTAFEWLVRRHGPGVIRYCAALLRNPAAGEDVSQVVFSRVARHIGSFRGENFSGWLYRIARNECLNALASQRRAAILTEELGNAVARESNREPAAPPEHPLQEILRQELPLLQNEQRTCLMLFYMEGYSYEEVAAYTDLTVGGVKSHIQNGKNALRKSMERRRQKEEKAGELRRGPIGPAPVVE